MKSCVFTWTIPQFSTICASSRRKSLQSGIFSTGRDDGSRWFLEIVFWRFGETDNVDFCLNTDSTICSDMHGNGRLSALRSNGDEVCSTEFNFNFDIGNRCMILNAKLEEVQRLVTEDDQLILVCNLKYEYSRTVQRKNVSAHNESPANLQPKQTVCPQNIPVPDPILVRDLERILKDKDFSDVTLSIAGKNYPVHKAMLAGRSTVFRTMFKKSVENRIVIEDMEEETFDKILLYIYTGKTGNLERSALHLLPAAEKYKLGELKQMCEEVLTEILSIGNVSHILILADEHNAKELKTSALEFIKTNRAEFRNIKNTELHRTLKATRPQLLNDLLDACFQ